MRRRVLKAPVHLDFAVPSAEEAAPIPREVVQNTIDLLNEEACVEAPLTASEEQTIRDMLGSELMNEWASCDRDEMSVIVERLVGEATWREKALPGLLKMLGESKHASAATALGDCRAKYERQIRALRAATAILRAAAGSGGEDLGRKRG